MIVIAKGKMMLRLLWALSISILFLKDKEKLYKLYLFLALAIPFNNKIYEIIGFNLVRGVTLLDSILFILFIISLRRQISKGYRPLKFEKLVLYILLLIVVIYLFIGFDKFGLGAVLDSTYYFRILVIYFVYSEEIVSIQDLKKYIKLICTSIITYSLIIVIIYSFRDKVTVIIYDEKIISWWGTSRVAFGNTTNVLIVPLITYVNRNIISRRFYLFLYIAAMFTCYTSQSISLNVSFILLTIMAFINRERKVLKNLWISTFIILSMLATLAVYKDKLNTFINTSSNPTVNKLNKFIENDVHSWEVRTTTNQLNKSMYENIEFAGKGLGTMLILFNTDYTESSSTLFIDNGLLTIAVKMGYVTVGIIAIVLISLLCRLISQEKLRVGSRIGITIGVITYLYVSGILNAQTIYSLPVANISILAAVCLTSNQIVSKSERIEYTMSGCNKNL